MSSPHSTSEHAERDSAHSVFVQEAVRCAREDDADSVATLADTDFATVALHCIPEAINSSSFKSLALLLSHTGMQSVPDDLKTTFLAHAAFKNSFAAVGLLVHACPWDETVTAAAVSGGNLDMLRFLRSGALSSTGERCPWGPLTCLAAVRKGDKEMLRVLRSRCVEMGMGEPCPWDERACEMAARKGNLDMLNALCTGDLEFGEQCPCGPSAHAAAVKHGHADIAAALVAKGCFAS